MQKQKLQRLASKFLKSTIFICQVCLPSLPKLPNHRMLWNAMIRKHFDFSSRGVKWGGNWCFGRGISQETVTAVRSLMALDQFVACGQKKKRKKTLYLSYMSIHKHMYMHECIDQGLHSSRVWHRVSFLKDFNRFEFRVFLFLDWLSDQG